MIGAPEGGIIPIPCIGRGTPWRGTPPGKGPPGKGPPGKGPPGPPGNMVGYGPAITEGPGDREDSMVGVVDRDHE